MLKYFFTLILFAFSFLYAGDAGNEKPPMDYDKVGTEVLDIDYKIETRLIELGIFRDRYTVVSKKYVKGIIAGVTQLSDEYRFNFKYKRDSVYLSGFLLYVAYDKNYFDLKNKCKNLYEKLTKSNKNNKK